MKRILVVEDEDSIRDFVVINLRRSGYEVTDAPNGEEGYRLFMEDPQRYDIALLDVMVPGTVNKVPITELKGSDQRRNDLIHERRLSPGPISTWTISFFLSVLAFIKLFSPRSMT